MKLMHESSKPRNMYGVGFRMESDVRKCQTAIGREVTLSKVSKTQLTNMNNKLGESMRFHLMSDTIKVWYD